jgi:uracil-DNA glycosylase
MVLGHDFHSEAEYSKSVKRGKENLKAATWRNLIQLLKAAGIAPRHCFFTNFYMGLREGPATTGVFPGSTDPDFVYACQQFYLEQLRQQRPKVILVLGVHVPRQLAPMAPELQQWSTATTLKDFNAAGMAGVHQVRFTVHVDAVNVVMLAHPSQRLLNVRHRSYKGMVGQGAELGMVGDAVGWRLA